MIQMWRDMVLFFHKTVGYGALNIALYGRTCSNVVLNRKVWFIQELVLCGAFIKVRYDVVRCDQHMLRYD